MPPVCRSETVEILGSIPIICSEALKFCGQQLVVHSLIFTITVYFAVSRLFFLRRLHFELSAVQSVSILKFSPNLPPVSATILPPPLSPIQRPWLQLFKRPCNPNVSKIVWARGLVEFCKFWLQNIYLSNLRIAQTIIGILVLDNVIKLGLMYNYTCL